MGNKLTRPVLVGGRAIERFGVGGDGSPEGTAFPLLFAGRYTFGNVTKEYVGADVEVLPLEGISMLQFRFERPSGYAIANLDPNRDKAMYIKYTNYAECLTVSTPHAECYGLNVEVDQRGKIATCTGLYVFERIRDEITTSRIARFEYQIGSGETVPNVLEGVRIDVNNPNNAPADCAGLIINNKETTGINTPPEGAIRIESGSTSSGWYSAMYIAAGAITRAYSRPVWIHDETADIVLMVNNGAPTDGTTGAGYAGKGSILIDYSTPRLYQNVGTKATPNWDYVTTWT